MTTADAMHALRKRPVAGRGRVIGYPGGSLWIGRLLGPVQEHAHHAIQISLSMEGGFGIRADGWPDFREATGMVVMPDRPHSLDGRNGAIATLFVDRAMRIKRFTPAAMGRATPIQKRTSHVEIVVAEREQREGR